VSRKAHDGFSERFKQALDEAGLGPKSETTQKELGRLFGVSGQAVKKWLDGDSIPAAERAPVVAKQLGVRRAWLLDNELPMRVLNSAITEDGKHYGSVPDHDLTYEEQQVLLFYRRLNKKMQKNWLKLLKDFVETTEK